MGEAPFTFNPSAAGVCAPILPGGRAVISAADKKKKKRCSECQCQKQANVLPSHLFPFSSIVLTVLENGAYRGKTCETVEYKLSKVIIQNYFCAANPPMYTKHQKKKKFGRPRQGEVLTMQWLRKE